MRLVPRALLALGLGYLVASLLACGGSTTGLLDSGSAGRLQSDLDNVGSAVSSGDCGQTRTALGTLAGDVSGLPANLDATLRRSLSDSAGVLGQQAARDCGKSQTTKSTTTPTVTSTTTSTATTTTAPTDTTPPPTNPTTDSTSTPTDTNTGAGPSTTTGGGSSTTGSTGSGGASPSGGATGSTGSGSGSGSGGAGSGGAGAGAGGGGSSK